MADNTTKIAEFESTLQELKRRREADPIAYFEPYEVQKEFFAMGATKRERLFCAANQIGKSRAASFEMACHLLGDYPKWWPGKKFGKPIKAWASGVTAESVRDTLQSHLLGPSKPYGTAGALIPEKDIISVSMQRGVSDSVDTVFCKHKSGGTSSLSFKSYNRGRQAWQGATLDAVLFDEEPDDPSIYSEGLARISATGGIAFMVFTPLKGVSDIVRMFFDEDSDHRGVVQAGLDDALHFSEAQKKAIVASYRPHEIEARTKGIPMLGSGAVFPIAESLISINAFSCPDYWPTLAAVDFGFNTFAAIKLRYDRDDDAVYIVDTFTGHERTISDNANALRTKWGGGCPIAWPHDGLQHDRSAGVPQAQLFREAGLNMLPDRVTFPDGSSSVEAGIAEMLDRFSTGRLKVFAHLDGFFTEFRRYHRDEKTGRIVKAADHTLDAVRYGIMGLRHARQIAPDGKRRKRRPVMAEGLDYDVFGGSDFNFG
jgi:phage terminase large subunit-like protein